MIDNIDVEKYEFIYALENFYKQNTKRADNRIECSSTITTMTKNDKLQANKSAKTNYSTQTTATTDILLPPQLTNAIKMRYKISFCQKKNQHLRQSAKE